jgi:hypothetical protein
MAIAESFDVCGAHVAVAGSATTSCGDRPDGATPGASSSWTLTRATVTGTACGLSVAVAGDSSTSCSNSTQMSPVPGAAPNGSGTGTPGTGATGAAGSTEPPGAGGPASSPAAGGQPAQTPTDDGTTGHDESDSLAGAEVGGGSLPLTGTSVLMLLMIAAAVVAAGLVAVRTSRVRVGHQS